MIVVLRTEILARCTCDVQVAWSKGTARVIVLDARRADKTQSVFALEQHKLELVDRRCGSQAIEQACRRSRAEAHDVRENVLWWHRRHSEFVLRLCVPFNSEQVLERQPEPVHKLKRHAQHVYRRRWRADARERSRKPQSCEAVL